MHTVMCVSPPKISQLHRQHTPAQAPWLLLCCAHSQGRGGSGRECCCVSHAKHRKGGSFSVPLATCTTWAPPEHRQPSSPCTARRKSVAACVYGRKQLGCLAPPHLATHSLASPAHLSLRHVGCLPIPQHRQLGSPLSRAQHTVPLPWLHAPPTSSVDSAFPFATQAAQSLQPPPGCCSRSKWVGEMVVGQQPWTACYPSRGNVTCRPALGTALCYDIYWYLNDL